MPNSKFKVFWNFVTLILLIYTGTYVPFKVAFVSGTSIITKNAELCIDFFFLMDILVNFISAYYDT